MTAMVRRRAWSVALVAARGVAPAVLLLVLAVSVGVLRTAALGAFGLVVALRVVLMVLESVAECAPAPTYRWEVGR